MRYEMFLVDLDTQSSNQILDALRDWNTELEASLPVPEPDL
jgi:hypothetical protein